VAEGEATYESEGSAPLGSHAEHFESLEQQTHAAHLGMWVFLVSEILLFGALFALYAALRYQHPRGFDVGLEHSKKIIGSINTGILLISSYTIASSVLTLRDRKKATTLVLMAITLLLAASFLVLKGVEYSEHFREGIFPGAAGRFFEEHPQPGIAPFFTLYYLMTGLHALHVTIGMGVIIWMMWKVARGQFMPPADHPVSLGAMYWHLVDIVWIFLWPLFYLTAGH